MSLKKRIRINIKEIKQLIKTEQKYVDNSFNEEQFSNGLIEAYENSIAILKVSLKNKKV